MSETEGTWFREVLSRVAAWKVDEITAILSAQAPLEVDVSVLITDFRDLDTGDLLRQLDEELGSVGRNRFLAMVLERDPSIGGEATIAAGKVLSEGPVPRSLVALVYLMIMDAPEQDFAGLAEAIWANMLQGRALFWPELLHAILSRFHSPEALLERALSLVAEDDEHWRGVGEDLLYGFEMRRSELRRAIRQRILAESGAARRKRLQQLYKKYGAVIGAKG